MSFEFAYNDYYNLANRVSETREVEMTPFQAFFHSGDMVESTWSWSRERLFEPWQVVEGVELPGRRVLVRHAYGVGDDVRGTALLASVELGTGSFFSGTRRSFSGEFTWRKIGTSRRRSSWSATGSSLEEGDFNTSLVMFRLDSAFTPFISLSNFVQYDSESRNIGLQSRLRWIVAPGNELFVVLNHGWEENLLDRFESTQTRVRVKVNYILRFAESAYRRFGSRTTVTDCGWSSRLRPPAPSGTRDSTGATRVG